MKECQSCGAPMHKPEHHAGGDTNILLCKYCSHDDGTAKGFEHRFEHMVAWSMRHFGHDRTTAEQKAREHLLRLPHWRNHPALR